MIHLGDITKISGYDVPIVDCVVGGSPCQNFSVAGNQKGLGGDQSVLFTEQLRIVKEMRDRDARNGRTSEHIRPRFMVWENVPGAFSTNKGADFRLVLEEIAKIIDKDAVIPRPPKDKWSTSGCIVGEGGSIAWKILDAQFWGVPQRRRRIVLVADFGGQCAQEILFVRNGLQGDSEESRTERQRTSSNAEGSIGVYDRTRGESFSFEPGIASMEGGHIYEDVSGTAKGPGAVCYALQGNQVDHADTSVCNGSGYKEDICYTLNTMDRHAIAYCIGNGQVNDAVCPDEELCKTLNCMDDPMKIAIVYNGASITSPLNITTPQIGDACHTLTPDSRNYLVEIKPHYIVRRLTPLECERLQGFPDGWTDIGEYIDSKGKVRKTSDSARYKALGNSIALPPWKWVIKRLCSHYERDATMASLFDGIGGFPLIWEQINGKGSCLWASEIEEFPIAVTTARIE